MVAPSAKSGIVLVTGSSGLIGRAVVERLAPEFTLVGLDRMSSAHPMPQLETICADLADERSIELSMERVRYGYGKRIASVIHLAAYYDFSGQPSPLYDQITVQGTARLLQALADFDVEQFIFSSTMLVHAPCDPGERIDEDWPLEPKWDYPRSKVQTEEIIRGSGGAGSMGRGGPGRGIGGVQVPPSVILRIAGVYDDQCRSLPLAHQMQRIFERRMTSRVFPGDVRRGQAFVHLDDAAEAIRLTVERRRELPPRTTLLIGEDQTLSYDELQRTLGRLIHDEEWETTEIPKALAKTGAWIQDQVPWDEPFIKPWMIDLADDHYELDCSRARRLLGWAPKRSLRETLPRMVEFLKTDPAGFYRANKLEGAAAVGVQ